jgi:outer membrane protein
MNVDVTFATPSGRDWIRASVLAMTILVCNAHPAGAQSPPSGAQSPSGTLSIADVIATTLRSNPDVQIARAAVDTGRGARIQAARPFDTRPFGSFGGAMTQDRPTALTESQSSAHSTFATESRLGVSQMLRSGLIIEAETMMRRAPSLGSRVPLNQFTTTASVTVPLSLDNGGGLATTNEHAAVLAYGAAERTLRAEASDALLRATRAYWEYHAAYRRAEILRGAAARSRQSVQEVEILIAADERPKSDIDLMIANAAAKRSVELDAERQIIHAYNALLLAMGLDPDAARSLPLPVTNFPDPDHTAPLPLEPLLADALERHDGLAAALTRKQRAQVLSTGAARQFRPRIDLVFVTEYTVFRGGLLTNPLGPNASVQVVFEPSRVNSSTRGALIQADAANVQATTAADALARAVRLSVADALTALNTSQAQLASTREAVARSRQARETMERNFEVGTATLFDRILAEDTVTNAETADLNASVRYATALIELQYARGVLVGGHGADLIADEGRVLRARREDAR